MQTRKNNLSKNKLYLYKVYSTNFNEKLIEKILHRRNFRWTNINKNDEQLLKKPKNVDFCFQDGYYYTCHTIKNCIKSFHFMPPCKNFKVGCSLKVSLIDFLFKKNLYKINSKIDFYNIIGKSKFIPRTLNINSENYNQIVNSNIDLKNKWILKAADSYEREGLLRIDKVNLEEINNHLKTFKKFTKWQLQEFIEPLLDNEFFIRVDIVCIYKNNQVEVLYSNKNQFAGIKDKNNNNILHYAEKNNKMHMNDDTKKIVYTFDTMTKNEYTGINGIANTILNKKFGNKWYEKNILPQIHEFISTYSKKLFVPINNKNIIFHLFGLDIMIDREFKIKILEINIYPTHFLSGYREVYDEKYVSKLFSPPNQMEKLHEMLEYEEQFLDEIFHYTLDNIYPTKYSPKLKYLVKI